MINHMFFFFSNINQSDAAGPRRPLASPVLPGIGRAYDR